MAKNVIPPDSYARMSKELANVKKMGVSQFIQWVTSIYQSGHDSGWKACKDKYMDTKGGIVVDESLDVEIWEESDMLTLDDVLEAMLSVKGIGVRRANLVIEKLSEGSHAPIKVIEGVQ